MKPGYRGTEKLFIFARNTGVMSSVAYTSFREQGWSDLQMIGEGYTEQIPATRMKQGYRGTEKLYIFARVYGVSVPVALAKLDESDDYLIEHDYIEPIETMGKASRARSPLDDISFNSTSWGPLYKYVPKTELPDFKFVPISRPHIGTAVDKHFAENHAKAIRSLMIPKELLEPTKFMGIDLAKPGADNTSFWSWGSDGNPKQHSTPNACEVRERGEKRGYQLFNFEQFINRTMGRELYPYQKEMIKILEKPISPWFAVGRQLGKTGFNNFLMESMMSKPLGDRRYSVTKPTINLAAIDLEKLRSDCEQVGHCVLVELEGKKEIIKPASVKLAMTDKAGFSYEEYIKADWSDAKLIKHGFAKVVKKIPAEIKQTVVRYVVVSKAVLHKSAKTGVLPPDWIKEPVISGCIKLKDRNEITPIKAWVKAVLAAKWPDGETVTIDYKALV